MRAVTKFNKIGVALAGLLASGAAFAQEQVLPELESLGIPSQDGIGFQAPATELMSDVIWLDTFLLWIITIITVFVTILLLICIFKFNAKRNSKPATFTHNSALEVAWTVIPIVILIAIIPPSLTLLFKQQEIPEADVTIKAIGNQWYWTHEYVDHEFGFDSFIVDAAYEINDPENGWDENQPMGTGLVLDDLAKKKLAYFGYEPDEFLLATDTAVVVPTGKTIVVQVTGADVIHSWTIPAFGVKQDAVPGRLAQLWFKVDEGKEGIYFGQCSELCGKDHSYMPITVKAVSPADYEKWLNAAKAEYAQASASVKMADANMIKVLENEAAN